MYVTVGPNYSAASYRWLRTGLFTLFGAMGLVPAVHHCFQYGWEMAGESYSIKTMLQAGLLYLTGAFIYAYRFPERHFPVTFDIIGSSHQVGLVY